MLTKAPSTNSVDGINIVQVKQIKCANTITDTSMCNKQNKIPSLTQN